MKLLVASVILALSAAPLVSQAQQTPWHGGNQGQPPPPPPPAPLTHRQIGDLNRGSSAPSLSASCGVPSGAARPGDVPPLNVAGDWSSNFGDMRLTQACDSVTGPYGFKGGQIVGTMKHLDMAAMHKTELTGIWVQTGGSDHPCAVQQGFSQNGQQVMSNSWGEIEWQFTPDARSFTGRWTYCDNPRPAGQWSGSRK